MGIAHLELNARKPCKNSLLLEPITRMIYLKRKPVAIFLIALSAALIGVVTLFSSQSGAANEKKKTAPKSALTVTTVLPTQTRLPIKLSANGSIAAWQEAIVGSETNGLRLLDVRVNVGDKVRAGQVLATFATDTVQAEVAQSRASTAEAEANALDAAGNAEKARTLQASGALSEQQINQYLTAAKTAQARLESARATLAVQQVRLKQTQLLAPDNGIISARAATVGAVVGTGTELFRLIRGGRIEWRAEVTSSELGRLSIGIPVSVVAANGVALKGRVRMIAPTVDLQTRSALVYVDLLNNSDAVPVKAGMFAKGEFDLGMSDALTVPQLAVVIRDGFSYVFVLGSDSHVSRVKVQTGRRLGERVEVIGGLKSDAELVASGAGFLNDGDLVSKVSAAANTEGAASNTANSKANKEQP